MKIFKYILILFILLFNINNALAGYTYQHEVNIEQSSTVSYQWPDTNYGELDFLSIACSTCQTYVGNLNNGLILFPFDNLSALEPGSNLTLHFYVSDYYTPETPVFISSWYIDSFNENNVTYNNQPEEISQAAPDIEFLGNGFYTITLYADDIKDYSAYGINLNMYWLNDGLNELRVASDDAIGSVEGHTFIPYIDYMYELPPEPTPTPTPTPTPYIPVTHQSDIQIATFFFNFLFLAIIIYVFNFFYTIGDRK